MMLPGRWRGLISSRDGLSGADNSSAEAPKPVKIQESSGDDLVQLLYLKKTDA
jgi:hypothetical protein